ncbi:hypothetical protein DFH28DRAFT_406478 [Melampsora americana]|nr:hypothetical protein DFH28DRAFT_406478 [Melampsora americana]
MKQSILTATIVTLISWYSCLMVQTHIDDYLSIPHQIENGNTAQIKSTGDALSGQHSPSQTMQKVDDQANYGISTCLQELENKLMEETDFNELDNIEDYSRPDLTFWMHSLQGITTMDESNNIASHMSPKPKRNKCIMTVPSQQVQVLGSSARGIPQHQAIATPSETEHMDESTSPLDTEIVEISPQTRTKKQKMSVVDVQHDMGTFKTKRPSISQSKCSKDSLKIANLTQEKLSHSQFRARSVFILLETKGSLALWHNPKAIHQIEDFFDKFKKKHHSTLSSLSNPPYSDHQVEVAIRRMSHEVLLAYSGGLSIACQGSSIQVSIADLVANGWEYLQNYLEQGFHTCMEESFDLGQLYKRVNADYFSHPWIVWAYILRLGSSSSIHPSLIEALVSNWARQTIYKPNQYDLQSSEHSFLAAIVSEAKLRGRKIWRERSDKIEKKTIPISNSLGVMKTQCSEINEDKLKRQITEHPGCYLEKIGNHLLENHKGFSSDLKSFFQTLEADMKTVLYKNQALTFGELRTRKHQNTMIIHFTNIQNTINEGVQNFIVPAFMGALVLFHQDQESDELIETLLRSGSSILKSYFSKWRNLLSGSPSSFILTRNSKAVHRRKWYDTRDSLQYLFHHRSNGIDSVEIVWFLYDIWYEEMIQKRLTGGEEINFELVPPHRSVAQEIFSFFTTRGISFK